MASTPNRPSPPASRRPLVYLLIGILIGALGVLAAGGIMMQWKAYSASPEYFLSRNLAADKSIVQTKSGLQYKVLTPGKGGAKPTDQDVALVNYEGKLTDGTTFDKSQQPTPMPLTGVVPGFSEALKLMTKGAKYRFWIKPSLGYGDKATGPIPANSVLVFDLELLDFLPEATIRQMQMQRQMQQQGGAASPGAGGPPPGK
jgi:FKBP-type peptidyl-prolyl cis-trans isomerase FkpA